MKPYLIGIASPSGAGKTFLAEHIVHELRDATILPLDAYYPDLGHLSLEERGRQNYDDPNILDFALLLAQVRTLSEGKTILQPVYDFTHHTRTTETRRVDPHSFLILEGLFTLYWPELRDLLHSCVYVEMTDSVCFERRMARDVAERGRSRHSVEVQFAQSVLPMAERYVRPTAQYADVRVIGNQPIGEEVAAVLVHIRCKGVLP
ncbi:MAG TPA: uridine kinase [Candidatus Koribacter sp.]|jgi:uridine kinase